MGDFFVQKNLWGGVNFAYICHQIIKNLKTYD